MIVLVLVLEHGQRIILSVSLVILSLSFTCRSLVFSIHFTIQTEYTYAAFVYTLKHATLELHIDLFLSIFVDSRALNIWIWGCHCKNFTESIIISSSNIWTQNLSTWSSFNAAYHPSWFRELIFKAKIVTTTILL